MRVAVLGIGFGEHHVGVYKKMPKADLRYIFGRNPEKLAHAGKKYSVRTTVDYGEILGDPSIDLVDICLPTELHKEYAIRALESGKHVLCETPIACTTSEANEIKKAADRNGRNVYVDPFTKYSAPHRIGIEYAKSGKIGTIKHVYAYNKTSNIWGDLSIDKSLLNFFIHNLDFIMEIMGIPNSFSAFGIPMQNKSIIEANYSYNGAMATLISDSSLPLNSPFLIGFDLIGDAGSIRFNASYRAESEQKLIYNDGKSNIGIDIPATDDYEEVIRHVLDCIERNEKSENIDVSDAIDALVMVEKTKDAMVTF